MNTQRWHAAFTHASAASCCAATLHWSLPQQKQAKASLYVTFYTLDNVPQLLILKTSSTRAWETFTISPKASPLQLVSSGLIPVDDRSEWAGETGGEELVLTNCLNWGAVIWAPPLSAVAMNGKEATPILLSADWEEEETPPTTGAGGVLVLDVVGALVPPFCSWKFFSRSIRSFLVPETVKPRTFNSCFSSATCRKWREWQDVIGAH